MKQLCANCGKRPASFTRPQGPDIKHDARHDLCRQCKRSQQESDEHSRVATTAKESA